MAAATIRAGPSYGQRRVVFGKAHVAYKPVTPAEPRKSQEWFPLPSMFKLCNHERPVVDDSPTSLSVALEALRGFSGTPLSPVER